MGVVNTLRQLARFVRLSSATRKARIARASSVLLGREPASVGRYLASPPTLVETDAKAQSLETMFQRTAGNWSEAGTTDPYWSVLTHDRFRPAKFPRSKPEFYASGHSAVRLVRTFFERNGRDFDAVEDVLDFGCGVGRVAIAFSVVLPKVHAVDVSMRMLDIARAEAAKQNVANIDFIHLASLDACNALPEADLFYSILVLQHNAPPMIAAMLDRCLAKVRPHGYAFFQVPTYRPDYAFRIDDYLRRTTRALEVHVLPQREVFSILARGGFNLLEVQEEGMVPGVTSQTFFAERKA